MQQKCCGHVLAKLLSLRLPVMLDVCTELHQAAENTGHLSSIAINQCKPNMYLTVKAHFSPQLLIVLVPLLCQFLKLRVLRWPFKCSSITYFFPTLTVFMVVVLLHAAGFLTWVGPLYWDRAQTLSNWAIWTIKPMPRIIWLSLTTPSPCHVFFPQASEQWRNLDVGRKK